eukprot:TRINITY_DN7552_c0_g1_i2.p1 TRINITY_DN7552_c0_g1~~TRINITY_DN7552_c0_g1_i2.p1  ORF type:complete len:182 (+),score=14.64 TRINITY_DN7552_c0_g1_i2:105-650(+)
MRRGAHSTGLHKRRQAHHSRRQQRGPAGRGLRESTSRPIRLRPGSGGCVRHASLSQIHHRPSWQSDFGRPDDSEEDFHYLKGYSPYHNVAQPKDGGQYPAMLLLTASHDDRVSPLHTFKHVAQLQHTLVKAGDGRQTNPLVARIDTKAGHGAGKPTDKMIEEVADMWAFAAAAVRAEFVST